MKFIASYIYQNEERFQNPIMSYEGNSTMAEILIKCAIINFPVMHLSESHDFISLQLSTSNALIHK